MDVRRNGALLPMFGVPSMAAQVQIHAPSSPPLYKQDVVFVGTGSKVRITQSKSLLSGLHITLINPQR